MPTKTIKDVDEKTWRKLRMLSAEEDMKMGELLKSITETYVKSKESVWAEILKRRKILSENEANDMEKIVKKIREERGFR